ncbi:MAG: dolichol kinase [Sulfolobales archaeon]|nr:dolichol kinase [Sulfolobales archaeon]MCX8186339.1 dolichol kinase [Sulfolobales archaeon]MDW7968925.1 dolichol kinase [Sulfolobales archaeon]
MVLDSFSALISDNLLTEIYIALPLFIYVLGVILLTKYIYNVLRSRGLSDNIAVYYNRKIIHMMTGGVIGIVVPYLFTSPYVPTAFALLLAVVTYIPHRTGRLLYWFQVKDNMYEVNFCIAWGFSLIALWFLFGNPKYAVIPIAFISFGDAITGIIRNAVYKRRTKSWLGNLGMLIVTLPIGIYYAGYAGFIAALVASIVEHYEIPPMLDDNVLITLSTLLVLIISGTFGFL